VGQSRIDSREQAEKIFAPERMADFEAHRRHGVREEFCGPRAGGSGLPRYRGR
jgi:hypothetical protein